MNTKKALNKKNRVVYTTGVFDLLHPGHINILKKAKSSGGELVVGVQKDESVFRQKGKNPIMTFEERVAVLESLPFVDKVVGYSDLDQRKILRVIKPDVMAQSEDWVKGSDRKAVIDYLAKNGIELKIFPYTQGISTTMIRRRIVDSENIFRNDVDLIKKKIQILPISSLSIYEKFDPIRTAVLHKKIKKDKVFIDPIVVGQYGEFRIVIDGANRLEAVRRAGYNNILANVIDYDDIRQVILNNNAHFLNINRDELLRLFKNRRIKLIKSSKERATGKLVSGKICGIVSCGKEFFELDEYLDLASGVNLLNSLVDSYLGKYEVFRLSELSQDNKDFYTKITFRRFALEDILEIIKKGLFLNSGVTWHQVRNSIVRFNLPLHFLKKALASKKLAGMVEKKIKNKSVRFYPANIFICDDWE